MRQPYLGPWHGSAVCPACGVWDGAAGPHAPTCDLLAQLHQYAADCASGRVNAPGYWITRDEIVARTGGG